MIASHHITLIAVHHVSVMRRHVSVVAAHHTNVVSNIILIRPVMQHVTIVTSVVDPAPRGSALLWLSWIRSVWDPDPGAGKFTKTNKYT